MPVPLFDQYEIPYRSVDLDSVAYQENNRGGKLREALRQHTGSNTLPQIFIGGEFMGGCTELFDACMDGNLTRRLNALDVDYNQAAQVQPYSLLPGWLHPR